MVKTWLRNSNHSFIFQVFICFLVFFWREFEGENRKAALQSSFLFPQAALWRDRTRKRRKRRSRRTRKRRNKRRNKRRKRRKREKRMRRKKKKRRMIRKRVSRKVEKEK